MNNIKNHEKRLSKWQNVALFCVCLLVPALLVWAASRLSGMMSDTTTPAPAAPNGMLASLLWIICSAAMGIGLFLALTASIRRERQQTVKLWSVSLWGSLFILCLTWPFFMYSMHNYMLSFVWLLIIDAVLAALIVINLRLRPLSAFAIFPLAVFAVYMTYAALYLAIYI